MSKYCGPRLRIIRRLGKLSAFTTKTRKRTTRPGQHGINRRKTTQFAVRLAEKQKLRFYYGISEGQLVRYVKRARRKKGSTGQILLQQLEIRLDNIIYRLGWAPTLPIARQLVNHGHILVNDKCVTIASFACIPLQVIKIRDARNIRHMVEISLIKSEGKVPSHLSLNINNTLAIINHLATRQDIPLELNELLVIEYYSNRLSKSIRITIYFFRGKNKPQ